MVTSAPLYSRTSGRYGIPHDGPVVFLRLVSLLIGCPCDFVDVLVIKEGRAGLPAVHGTELNEAMPVVCVVTKSMRTKNVFESQSVSSNPRVQFSSDDRNIVRNLVHHVLGLLGRRHLYQHHVR